MGGGPEGPHTQYMPKGLVAPKGAQRGPKGGPKGLRCCPFGAIIGKANTSLRLPKGQRPTAEDKEEMQYKPEDWCYILPFVAPSGQEQREDRLISLWPPPTLWDAAPLAFRQRSRPLLFLALRGPRVSSSLFKSRFVPRRGPGAFSPLLSALWAYIVGRRQLALPIDPRVVVAPPSARRATDCAIYTHFFVLRWLYF